MFRVVLEVKHPGFDFDSRFLETLHSFKTPHHAAMWATASLGVDYDNGTLTWFVTAPDGEPVKLLLESN